MGVNLKPIKIKRNQFLRKFLLEPSYKPKALVDRPDWLFDDYLELAVARELLRDQNFFFLQIGAFDGVSNDPISPLVNAYKISGIVVEPQKSAFEKLRKNYQEHEQITVVNAAISDKNEMKNFYTSINKSIQTASFDRRHLRKHRVPENDIVCYNIQCTTIESLLNEHKVHHCSLIQIDAEGYDYEIIKSLDFNKIKPSILHFEHRHLSDKDLNECIHLLASHGYEFVAKRRDILAIIPL